LPATDHDPGLAMDAHCHFAARGGLVSLVSRILWREQQPPRESGQYARRFPEPACAARTHHLLPCDQCWTPVRILAEHLRRSGFNVRRLLPARVWLARTEILEGNPGESHHRSHAGRRRHGFWRSDRLFQRFEPPCGGSLDATVGWHQTTLLCCAAGWLALEVGRLHLDRLRGLLLFLLARSNRAL